MWFDKFILCCGRGVVLMARGISLFRVGYLVGCRVPLCSHLQYRFFFSPCMWVFILSRHHSPAEPILLERFLHFLEFKSVSHFSVLC